MENIKDGRTIVGCAAISGIVGSCRTALESGQKRKETEQAMVMKEKKKITVISC